MDFVNFCYRKMSKSFSCVFCALVMSRKVIKIFPYRSRKYISEALEKEIKKRQELESTVCML